MTNSFIDQLYQNGEGCSVTGRYDGVPFEGVISLVRSTYGGGLNVYIGIPGGIIIRGNQRDSIVVSAEEMLVNGPLVSNVHVYF